MNERLRLALSPPAEVSRRDTSLRFTDILFGFVIREIFLRLQEWATLDGIVRAQLATATVLVLGSWIGFRRSVNRSDYEVKVVNLPLARFVLDQCMVVLYFRVSTLSGDVGQGATGTPALARDTVALLVAVFVLYLLWDLLGMWMATAREVPGRSTSPRKYRAIDQETSEPTDAAQVPNRAGTAITGATLVVLALLLVAAHAADGRGAAVAVLAGSALALGAYRFAKEVRTSWASAPSS